MTNEEMQVLLLEWMERHGGVMTEKDGDSIAAILAEHFLSFEDTPLKDAMRVLGLAE